MFGALNFDQSFSHLGTGIGHFGQHFEPIPSSSRRKYCYTCRDHVSDEDRCISLQHNFDGQDLLTDDTLGSPLDFSSFHWGFESSYDDVGDYDQNSYQYLPEPSYEDRALFEQTRLNEAPAAPSRDDHHVDFAETACQLADMLPHLDSHRSDLASPMDETNVPPPSFEDPLFQSFLLKCEKERRFPEDREIDLIAELAGIHVESARNCLETRLSQYVPLQIPASPQIVPTFHATAVSAPSETLSSKSAGKKRLHQSVQRDAVEHARSGFGRTCGSSHSRKARSDLKFQCTRGCGYSTNRRDDWQRHEQKWQPQGLWHCVLCRKMKRKRTPTFHRSDKILSHLQKFHSVPGIKNRQKLRQDSFVDIPVGYEEKCKYVRRSDEKECGYRFQSWQDRMAHYRQHFDEQVPDGPWELKFGQNKWFDDDDDDDDQGSDSSSRSPSSAASRPSKASAKASESGQDSNSSRSHHGSSTSDCSDISDSDESDFAGSIECEIEAQQEYKIKHAHPLPAWNLDWQDALTEKNPLEPIDVDTGNGEEDQEGGAKGSIGLPQLSLDHAVEDSNIVNELRKHHHPKPHGKLSNITKTEEVVESLRNLYDAPDNVELYPGLVVEDTEIPAQPGLRSPSKYTVNRSVLSDATALVPGDRLHKTSLLSISFSTSAYCSAPDPWTSREQSRQIAMGDGPADKAWRTQVPTPLSSRVPGDETGGVKSTKITKARHFIIVPENQPKEQAQSKFIVLPIHTYTIAVGKERSHVKDRGPGKSEHGIIYTGATTPLSIANKLAGAPNLTKPLTSIQSDAELRDPQSQLSTTRCRPQRPEHLKCAIPGCARSQNFSTCSDLRKHLYPQHSSRSCQYSKRLMLDRRPSQNVSYSPEAGIHSPLEGPGQHVAGLPQRNDGDSHQVEGSPRPWKSSILDVRFSPNGSMRHDKSTPLSTPQRSRGILVSTKPSPKSKLENQLLHLPSQTLVRDPPSLPRPHRPRPPKPIQSRDDGHFLADVTPGLHHSGMRDLDCLETYPCCPMCAKHFQRPDVLVRHVQSVHGASFGTRKKSSVSLTVDRSTFRPSAALGARSMLAEKLESVDTAHKPVSLAADLPFDQHTLATVDTPGFDDSHQDVEHVLQCGFHLLGGCQPNTDWDVHDWEELCRRHFRGSERKHQPELTHAGIWTFVLHISNALLWLRRDHSIEQIPELPRMNNPKDRRRIKDRLLVARPRPKHGSKKVPSLADCCVRIVAAIWVFWLLLMGIFGDQLREASKKYHRTKREGRRHTTHNT